ncbi:hypothetical protein L4C34_07625 [Vibrio profundum]|uniref:hypothetical protein n=1 Tax=Vibrio profundum TaxID=2910247 RepID=UPI003D125C7F
MKAIIIMFFLVMSFNIMAKAKQSDYVYYQTNDTKGDPSGSFAAYMLKTDPCMRVKVFKTGEETRYCKMDNSGIDLRVASPSAWLTDQYVHGNTVSFYVAAPWGEQTCIITVSTKSIKCVPQGR